jgi:tetratricopeptide (TPR) repeat protein
LLLCGDWFHAEAFLEKALQYKPNDRTLLLLLAIAQSRRGKLQSAILYARKACEPKAMHVEHAKLLIDLLLQAGYARDAQGELNRLQTVVPNDPELLFAMVRLNLQLREINVADECLQRMRSAPIAGDMLVNLARSYEIARQYQTASDLYQEALKAGHYPEALLGLGRVEKERRNRETARRHILEALNLSRPLGENATGPLPLFNTIVGHLVALEEPVPHCKAWIASFDGSMKPQALANTSLLVYATARQQAEQSLDAILNAMEPGVPVSRYGIFWKDAPKERQPEIPVRPGVQSVC